MLLKANESKRLPGRGIAGMQTPHNDAAHKPLIRCATAAPKSITAMA